MNTAARLAAALETLAPFAAGASTPAVMLASILTSLQVGDTAAALEGIRAFGARAEAMGVAARLQPLFGQLLDAHGLATLVRLGH